MKNKLSDNGFSNWSPEQLPDLAGKLYLITGGNSGIGFETAKALAQANADIVIACRNPTKAKIAVEEINMLGNGSTESVSLDLADLSSVKSAAAKIHSRYEKIDGLINNAGVMQPPQTKTVDGFELQFATNHLGHFLLTSLLFDLVEKASGRIVVVSSIVHKFGEINFDDLMQTKEYNAGKAYGQSKLANLMFALELDRKLKKSKSSVSCIACHPGLSSTELFKVSLSRPVKFFFDILQSITTQSAKNGAIPSILASAGREAIAGSYYGPQSMWESRGKISDAKVKEHALNQEVAAKLWKESESLVGHVWKVGSLG